MRYRELIKKVQDYSGFSDTESEEALQLMVESVAVHLTEGERKGFANQLPTELQDIALTVLPTDITANEDIIQQFMDLQDIDEGHAKTQIKAAWQALKQAISGREIEDIKAQMPGKAVALMQ